MRLRAVGVDQLGRNQFLVGGGVGASLRNRHRLHVDPGQCPGGLDAHCPDGVAEQRKARLHGGGSRGRGKGARHGRTYQRIRIGDRRLDGRA